VTITTLSSTQTHRTWLAAQHHGGSFISALADAWFRGDSHNRARIEAAFPEVVEEYGPNSKFYPHETEQ